MKSDNKERKEKKIEAIPVAFAIDNNYLLATDVAICSLLLSDPHENYDFFIIHSTPINEDDKLKLINDVKRLSYFSNVNFILMANIFKHGFADRWFNTSCYNLIMISWLLPEHSKVIYSDSDVIFKTGLRELYETVDIENFYIAGVNYKKFNDPVEPMYSHIKSLGLKPSEYINDGLMIINCDLQRKHNLLPQFIKLIGKPFHCLDQDIINLVCKGKIFHIDRSYNVDPRREEPDIKNPKILHFIGAKKPWNKITSSWEEWAKPYKESSFFNPIFYKNSKRIIRKNIIAKYKKQLIKSMPSRLLQLLIFTRNCLQYPKSKRIT